MAVRILAQHFIRDVSDRPRGSLGWKSAGAVCESHRFYARLIGSPDERRNCTV
jgi:hypothetical protein